LEAVGRHVTIGAGAAVSAQAVDLAVHKCVKTALHGSALLADAIDIMIGGGNWRLGHQHCSDGRMGKRYQSVHGSSSPMAGRMVCRVSFIFFSLLRFC
jgi:hypothetical protein